MYLFSLFLVILEIFPKYDNTILISNFRNDGKNRFLNKYIINKFCYTFVNKFCRISIFVKDFLKCFNFKMKFGKIRHNCELLLLFKSVYTKPNLYSSATKLLKLVYTKLNLFFLKTLVVNLSFSLQILRSRKEKQLSFSVTRENLIFLCLLFM